MGESDLGPRLSRRLTYLFKRALLDLEDLHRDHLEPVGVTVRELAVLLALEAREPESQQQTAARMNVDRTTMVALLDGLEAKGLVSRRAAEEDRRRNVVALTDAGRKTLGRAIRASDKAERQLLGDLDPDEQAHLRVLLARVAAAHRDPASDH